jgi:hypothetical protein
MDERLTKQIYKAGLDGNAVRRRSRRTLENSRRVLEESHVNSTRCRRECMRNFMKVDEV